MRLLALASVVSFAVARAAFAQDEDHVWLYEELDTLALRTLDALQHTSIAENREYCGYLGVDASGQVAATPAVPGTVDSCLPVDPPAAFEIYASYHTHGAYSPDEDSEVPSYEDLQGDIEEGVDGYIATPGQLWAWFCTTSVLARALGLAPFKDVFRGDPAVAGHHGEPEALLSALSTGPVGVGDRVGRLDPALVMRTCRADGILIKPHVPVAATSASMTSGAAGRSVLMVAECFSDHPAGRWAYVVTMRCSPRAGATTGDVRLGALGESAPTGPVVVWDWRRRTATPMDADGSWTCTLEREEWDFRVVAPVLPSGIAVIGDPDTFVTAGDARVEVRSTDRGAAVVVKGAGEQVVLTGWSARPPERTDAVDVHHDASTGVWTTAVDVTERGWTRVEFIV